MEFKEKSYWKHMTPSNTTYGSYEEAIKGMEGNDRWNNMERAELRNSEGSLVAIYTKGKGVEILKEVKEVEEVVVSKETFDIITNSDKHFYQLFADWQAFGERPLDRAMAELNRIYPDKHVSDIFDMVTKGEAKIVSKNKQYRIILKGLHRFDRVQAYSEYVYLMSDGTIAKTKSFNYITLISEENLKELPEWAQALAEEVK